MTRLFCFYASCVDSFVGSPTHKRDDFLDALAQFCSANHIELSMEIESKDQNGKSDPSRPAVAWHDLSSVDQ